MFGCCDLLLVKLTVGRLRRGGKECKERFGVMVKKNLIRKSMTTEVYVAT